MTGHNVTIVVPEKSRPYATCTCGWFQAPREHLSHCYLDKWDHFAAVRLAEREATIRRTT